MLPPATAAIERVPAVAGMARPDITVGNYGGIVCFLRLARVPFTAYYPQTWQAGYRQRGYAPKKRIKLSGLPGTEQDKRVAANRAYKLQSERIANGIWGGAAARFGKGWTSGTQEAALIALYHLEMAKVLSLQAQATRQAQPPESAAPT